MNTDCELCHQPVFNLVASVGWDGGFNCDCEHQRHYVCAKCVTRWNLTVSLKTETLDICLDHVRTAQVIAGEEPPKSKFGFPPVDLDGTLGDPKHAKALAKWRNQVMGPQGVIELLATPMGKRVGAPHLVGLTRAEQDAMEGKIQEGLVEAIAKDVDQEYLDQAAEKLKALKAEVEERRKAMEDL